MLKLMECTVIPRTIEYTHRHFDLRGETAVTSSVPSCYSLVPSFPRKRNLGSLNTALRLTCLSSLRARLLHSYRVLFFRIL